MIKRIAVYCGARDGNDPVFNHEAQRLGKWLVSHNIELVYGAGAFGLMGTLARTVLQNGGMVHGVITSELAERGAIYNELPDVRIVPNMDIRKQTMMSLADGLLAFPGGFGTLEEISEAASWTTVGDNNKPVTFYNFKGFYDPLLDLFKQMNKAGFVEDSYLNNVYFGDQFDQILAFMQSYKAPAHRQYTKKI